MKKKENRRKIRDAAARIFAEKGFENTSTRDIARVAGISAASLYYYFDSKEDLLYQILDETISKGLEQIKDIERNKKDLQQRLISFLDIYTRTFTDDPYKIELFVHAQKSLNPEHRERLNEKESDYLKLLVKILDDLKKSGQMADLDSTVCAFAFFGMVSWGYRWYNPRGKIKPGKLFEMLKHIFTRGIYADHR